MVEEGLGLDVAGGGEIVTALRAAADPSTLVMHGNAKSDEEIAMAVESAIGLVVVDNADDVDRLEAAVPKGRTQDVLVRVTPGVGADTHASVLTGQHGSSWAGTGGGRRADRRIRHSPRLRMRGLHAHIGSQIMELEPFRESVAARSPLWASSRSTTSGAAWAPATRWTSAHPASANTSTRWRARRASTCPPPPS